jgi:choline dehydrogenase-like flavoprotein
LLLLSNRVMPAGLGNEHDLVGRYFMEHPHIPCASITFSRDRRWLTAYKNLTVHGSKVRAGICLSEAAQRHHSVANFSGIVVDRFLSDSTNAKQSPGYMALKLLLRNIARGRVAPQLQSSIGLVLRDLPDVVRGIQGYLAGRNGAIYARSEQVPNPDSRVTLSPDVDLFGLPKVRLDWRMNNLDKKTIQVGVELMKQEFARLGHDTITPDDWLMADDHSWPTGLRGGYHHMGTTRMSADPRTGVVDPDCCVHGVDNLYVAGSSVFPTGGYANPTLTLVALALRLSDLLRLKLAGSDQEVTVLARSA